MTGSDDETAVPAPVPATGVDSFLEARLHRPPNRPEWIERGRLLNRLDRAKSHPVSLIAAPAGYGKTTLVAQWMASQRAPGTAWLTLDASDNAPGRLWRHVAMALQRAGTPVADDLERFLAAHGHDVQGAMLPRIVYALATTPHETVLLIDDFHYLHDPARHDEVRLLIDNLPDRAHLVIVTRADPGLRLGRLRASGQLVEIRADELSFRADEASSLLWSEGVRLSGDGVARLMERTEGWPAGLYLAALSLTGRDDPDALVHEYKDGSRFVGDYLTEEVLGRQTDDTREFITSMSILDRFSASLCDAVSDRPGSASILHELERSNMFLVPLDEQRRWYRFHHLFAAVARAELEVEHPERVPLLHARAAEWFRERGHIDEAVRHALAAGSDGDAATLVESNWLSYVDAGRTDTVVRWLDALDTGSVAADPAAEVTAAWMSALAGDEGALSVHLEALQEFRDHGPLPDGTASVESAIALVQGLFGYGGPDEMTAGAQRAVELETDARTPYYSIAHLSRGHAAYVAGDLDLAAHHFATAVTSEAAPVVVRAASLSTHSLVEQERGQRRRSRDLAELAMTMVRQAGLAATPDASMAFTALGQAQAADGDTADALATLDEGMKLRRIGPDVGPWGMIHHLMTTARVYAGAGRQADARPLMAELAERMARFGASMDPMWARFAAIEEAIRELRDADGPVEELTARELDVLRLLQGSLSLGEISDVLHLSANTVKTHAQAVYRKLGAHSRTEAVRLARLHQLI